MAFTASPWVTGSPVTVTQPAPVIYGPSPWVTGPPVTVTEPSVALRGPSPWVTGELITVTEPADTGIRISFDGATWLPGRILVSTDGTAWV